MKKRTKNLKSFVQKLWTHFMNAVANGNSQGKLYRKRKKVYGMQEGNYSRFGGSVRRTDQVPLRIKGKVVDQMEKKASLVRTGNIAFFFSGICCISSGVIVNLLQERYGFNYSMTGTMLSMMSIGNMAASFATGILPRHIGTRNTAALLCAGHFLGYGLMAFFGMPGLLLACFLMVGCAKGCAINNCTVLVGNNSPDRTRGMSLMHACYAAGAMLCPFIIAFMGNFGPRWPMLGISFVGLLLWITFMTAGLPNDRAGKADKARSDFSFLKSGLFWLVTGLIFCQNAAETAVTGWLVTYYKATGLLSGSLSTYTVTIMWGATLIARLLIVFVFKIRNVFKALALMGLGCCILYVALILSGSPLTAVAMLFLFAFSMAGVNPVGMSGVGKLMSPTSVGVLIPVAGTGAIIMPWIIGQAADNLGLRTAMGLNLIPCAGILILSLILARRQKRIQENG